MWTSYAKDRFFAPKLSQLTTCEAPPLTVTPEQSKRWLPDFVLTSALRFSIGDPDRQLIFNFLRRADHAVLEYTRGRESLIAYVAGGNRRGITEYSRCLHSFEAAAGLILQAFQLLQQLHPDKPPLFARKDGSELQRLDRVYNASKHADEYIAKGGRYSPDSTLTVWLVNSGLECRAAMVTFAELAEGIAALARAAETLSRMERPGSGHGPAATAR